MIDGAIASHTLEPQFRKLGMVTTLAKGVPTLGAPHVVCREGDVLTPPQIQLFKLFGQQLSKVSSHDYLGMCLVLRSHYSARAF